MSEQFLFFCTNIGSEKFLKEEIKIFYPELTLSYSRKGFLTFKNKGKLYDKDSISQLQVVFATRSGICLGKATPDKLLDSLIDSLEELSIPINKCIVHSFAINTDINLDVASILNREVNEYSPINKTVIDIICLGEKEVWYGVHKVGKYTTHYPNSQIEIDVPHEAPSKSYLKIKEIVKLFNINVESQDHWLDFGCAPGGASFYLLSQGCQVWGIDPAKMPDNISQHPSFSHIKIPVQDLSQEELPGVKIKWAHVDMNLNPKQSIKEVLRLCKKYGTQIKGIIFTIQMIKMDHIKNIENFEDHFYDWGFTDIISCHVPSHKKEYVIIAKR
jgi:23S rRNA (cytidine2498-2'-O)-methyltransferase